MVTINAVGCAASVEHIRAASATSIGEQISEEVEIENIERGAKALKWDAKTKTFSYRCFADEKLRRTLCIKK